MTEKKSALHDPVLSFRAKGLWAYCVSEKDPTMLNRNRFKEIANEGKDAIYGAIKELMENGYLKKNQPKLNGQFGTVTYEII